MTGPNAGRTGPVGRGARRSGFQFALPGIDPAERRPAPAVELARIKQEMTGDEFKHLSDQRRLPNDHPSVPTRRKPPPRPKGPRYTEPARTKRTRLDIEADPDLLHLLAEVSEDPIYTSFEMALACLDVIYRSGAVPVLEQMLRSHRGQKSVVTAEVLLLIALLSGWKRSSYRRTDLCAVLAGLDPRVAVYLGLCNRDGLVVVSYKALQKQLCRLEAALYEQHLRRQSGERGCHDMQWLADKLIWASVPSEAAGLAETVIVDSSSYPTHSRTYDYTPGKRGGKRRKLPKDKLAQHRKDVLDNPDLEEPALRPRKVQQEPRIGQHGPDGRLVRSHDPHARPGWGSATGKRKAGVFLGYDVTIVVATYSLTWRGYMNSPGAARNHSPAYILSMAVNPAGENPGPTGFDAVQRALEVAPNIAEVIADRAYTVKRLDFNRPLHELGINVVMDQPQRVVKRADLRRINGKDATHIVVEHCGGYYVDWMPEDLWTPPEDLTEQEKIAWFNNRAQKYRYSPLGTTKSKDGKVTGIRFKCPVHAKRLKIKGSTAASAGNLLTAAGPLGGQCCQGTLTIPLAMLDLYQTHLYYTRAWKGSYSRRPQVENVLGMIQDKFGLEPGSCRASRLAPHAIAATALAVVHNIRLTRSADLIRDRCPTGLEDLTDQEVLIAADMLLHPQDLSADQHPLDQTTSPGGQNPTIDDQHYADPDTHLRAEIDVPQPDDNTHVQELLFKSENPTSTTPAPDPEIQHPSETRLRAPP